MHPIPDVNFTTVFLKYAIIFATLLCWSIGRLRAYYTPRFLFSDGSFLINEFGYSIADSSPECNSECFACDWRNQCPISEPVVTRPWTATLPCHTTHKTLSLEENQAFVYDIVYGKMCRVNCKLWCMTKCIQVGVILLNYIYPSDNTEYFTRLVVGDHRIVCIGTVVKVGINISDFNPKKWWTRGCVFSTVAYDALLLKYQAIGIHSPGKKAI